MIQTQEQLERLIRDWGFMPFFRNGVAGFSIEELTPPELLFGDDFERGPWKWKGPIIANWEAAYGKFFGRKMAGYVSLAWLPDLMNWRRAQYPLVQEAADARHILDVLVENESLLSKDLKKKSGFSLSRKKVHFDPQHPAEPIVEAKNGTAADAHIAQLQMATRVCIADFEYKVSKSGEVYGWGVARYCTPEAMYPELFPIASAVEGRTPQQSRERILAHLAGIFPDCRAGALEKLI